LNIVPPAHRTPTLREPGGWLTLDADEVDFYLAASPPRSHVLRRQLKTDFSSVRGAIIPAAGIAMIAVGVLLHTLLLAVLGVWVLVFYGAMLRSVTEAHRHAHVLVAKLSVSDEKHPVMPWIVLASAQFDDGNTIPVTVDNQLVEPFLERHEQLEALVLYMLKSERSTILATRSIALTGLETEKGPE
jgi:hypothetical protein